MFTLKQIFFALLVCCLFRCSSSVKETNIITTPDDYATYDTMSPNNIRAIESNVSNSNFSANFSNNMIQTYTGNTQVDSLEQEYQNISKQLDALQAEFKATINTQMVAQDYLFNPENFVFRKAYEKKMGILLKIRRENEENGLPLGPYIDNSQDISWVVETLKKNYDILSDKMSDLKKKKGKVATQQLLLKARG